VDADQQAGAYLGNGNGRSRLFARPGPGVKQVSAEFDRAPTAISAARSALMPFDDRLVPELLDDIRLMVSELVTNSVRHAGDDTSGVVSLAVKLRGDRVRVEVGDTGEGFEPKPREPGQSVGSGWGLYLVDKLSDRWGVMRGPCTNVWFEIDGATSFEPRTALA
jgi:anti-sigma regulatory factor (Ser/Thr protein kinase)